MDKLLLKLFGQALMKKIKDWLKENGFVGFLALAIAGGAAFFGWWMVAVGAICWFLGKNWEIVIKLWKESKLKDKVDEVKDKI